MGPIRSLYNSQLTDYQKRLREKRAPTVHLNCLVTIRQSFEHTASIWTQSLTYAITAERFMTTRQIAVNRTQAGSRSGVSERRRSFMVPIMGVVAIGASGEPQFYPKPVVPRTGEADRLRSRYDQRESLCPAVG